MLRGKNEIHNNGSPQVRRNDLVRLPTTGIELKIHAPITEEDMPKMKSVIETLKRYRKRDHAHDKRYTAEYLDDAIESLVHYGAQKGWWEDHDD